MARKTIRGIRRPTRLQTVCAQVAAMAEKVGPGGKLPTVLQMRDQLGASVATINSALNELEAQNIVERKHAVGIFASHKLHQKSITLLFSSEALMGAGISPFYKMLIEAAQKRAAKANEEFSLHLIPPDEPRAFDLQTALRRASHDGHVDGVLGVALGMEIGEWFSDIGVPYVSFAGQDTSVLLSFEDLLEQGLRRLHELGCKNIGVWAPYKFHFVPTPNGVPDESEFLSQAAELGMLVLPSLGLLHEHCEQKGQSAPHSMEQGYWLAQQVFGVKGRKPDGLLILDDQMSHGALTAMQQLGVKIGDKVQVVSHANKASYVLMPWENCIDRLEFDPTEVIEAMFSRLEKLINNEKISEVVVIHPQLITR